jgi:hypothetical protein
MNFIHVRHLRKQGYNPIVETLQVQATIMKAMKKDSSHHFSQPPNNADKIMWDYRPA